MKVVFVTPELEPVFPGGAGVVVAELARRLTPATDVSVVLGAPGVVSVPPLPFPVRVVDVGEDDGTVAWHLERSRRLADELAAVIGEGPVGMVEFTDFLAPAYWALTHRREVGLEGITVAVRFHGTVDAITAAVGAASPTLEMIAAIEQITLGLADVLLVPSAAVGRWVAARYDVDTSRVVVAPPPVPTVVRRPRPAVTEPVFVALGTLRDVKGAHDLARAMLPVFAAHPSSRLVFIGRDGWSATGGRAMSEVLHDLVPADWHDRMELTGGLSRDDALDRAATARAVVVASRFESFCLAAHEARSAGAPVVVPDLPAFADLGDGVGLMRYDRSVADLTRVLQTLAADPVAADALAGEPAPEVGDPLSAYRGGTPRPRHPQSQAGLATAAVYRVESLLAPPVPRPRLARRLLRLVPVPLARLAVRVLPQGLKDRFRDIASWRDEAAAREARDRRRAMVARIDGGEFVERHPPETSVVIPCYDQGRWVEDAVLSVFGQNRDDWEIVLVDDGSGDPDTVAVLDRLGRWPRVHLIRTGNRGLAAARNTGMEAARGRYLVPLDADDELAPEFLDALVPALEARPEAAFAHCWAELFGDVSAVWATRPFNPYWELLANSVVGCVLMRREAWRTIGGYDETMRHGNEDWELWLRLMEAGWDRVRVPLPLFRYRKHGVSMSVRTEGEFEAGVRDLAARHPGFYDPAALQKRRRTWYPLLSVMGPATVPGHLADDVEVVDSADLTAAVAAAHGKYLGMGGEVETLVALADRLEGDPGRSHAAEGGAVVWRRWALLDPDAGFDDLDAAPPGPFAGGRFPDPEWCVDPAAILPGRRLDRQRPEESGRLPGWLA